MYHVVHRFEKDGTNDGTNILIYFYLYLFKLIYYFIKRYITISYLFILFYISPL